MRTKNTKDLKTPQVCHCEQDEDQDLEKKNHKPKVTKRAQYFKEGFMREMQQKWREEDEHITNLEMRALHDWRKDWPKRPFRTFEDLEADLPDSAKLYKDCAKETIQEERKEIQRQYEKRRKEELAREKWMVKPLFWVCTCINPCTKTQAQVQTQVKE